MFNTCIWWIFWSEEIIITATSEIILFAIISENRVGGSHSAITVVIIKMIPFVNNKFFFLNEREFGQ